MERFLDILFSTFALTILLPLFIPLIIILRLTGEGEIFFLQERIGKGGKKFKLIKFATMLKNSPYIGTGTLTVKNDNRILPFGSFLRKSKINELPQLLNIFWGNMSLIGPRPLTNQAFTAYTPKIQDEIKKVRPGLSGVGSIIFRGEENIMQGSSASVEFYTSVIAPYKGKLEKWFISNRGIELYLKAIFLTVWIVLFPKSTLVWKIFKNLPQPPKELVEPLNYIH